MKQTRISNIEYRNKHKNKSEYRISNIETYCFGFILLEVLVSILILSIGLVAVIGAFSSSTKIISTTRRYSEAVQLAERKMFEIQTIPMEDWKTRDSGDFGDQYPDYTWEYEIEEKDSEFPEFESEITLEPEKYYQLTLRIKFEERNRVSVPIELVTYITKQVSYLDLE
jgi:type II secretory pathway pseudopilin PulG